MIASFDTIIHMKPPFTITPRILDRISVLERILGRIDTLDQPKPQPRLRKANRVRTIQGSLAIEGNSLGLDQVTALLDGKRVLGKKAEIQEVLNANALYDRMLEFDPYSPASLLKAHRLLMQDILPGAGRWRSGGVGIMKGKSVAHIAPPASRVAHLVKELMKFSKTDPAHPLIKAAVFHYEFEFIHPFMDGNGRLGRFWHTLLLARYHPAFEYTPVESLIKQHQQAYYRVLATCDRTGDSTAFIEFALEMAHRALSELVDNLRPEPATSATRLARAREEFFNQLFSRKDYLRLHKTISTATASRDLLTGLEQRLLAKSGTRARTVYRFA